jgi:preprotein translocase subunit SecE
MPCGAVFRTEKSQKTYMMKNFIEYLKDTKAEVKHVTWPTKDQTVSYTILVIFLSVVVALLLSTFDSIFRKVLEIVLQ